MKKTIRLYGDMGKRFGRVFHLDVATPAEAIRALTVIRPGFRDYLQARIDAPFRVIVGEEAQDEAGLGAPVGMAECIRIVPMVAGAKDGFGQILLGAALIVASMYIPGAWTLGAMSVSTAVAGIGFSMVLGGVAQMLAKTQPGTTGFSSNDLQTWTFGSPTVTVGQGGCVPLCYGKMRVGGHIISAGINAETWQDKGFGGLASNNTGTITGDGDTSPWVAAIAP
jgi:predicted phage tail protein